MLKAAEVSGNFQSRAATLQFVLLVGMAGRRSGRFETTIGRNPRDKLGNAPLLAISSARIANFEICPSIVTIRRIEFAAEGVERQ